MQTVFAQDRFLVRHTLVTALIAVAACATVACEQNEPPQTQRPETNLAPTPPSPWVASNNGAHVALTGSVDAGALRDAIEQAHHTTDDARARWQVATPEQRRNWSVKWAARTLEGGVEHVWVRPTHWSQWRIEGTLLTEPTRELESGAGPGDAVSFADDDLTDWLYLIDGRVDGPRNGGYTIDVLVGRHGLPTR